MFPKCRLLYCLGLWLLLVLNPVMPERAEPNASYFRGPVVDQLGSLDCMAWIATAEVPSSTGLDVNATRAFASVDLAVRFLEMTSMMADSDERSSLNDWKVICLLEATNVAIAPLETDVSNMKIVLRGTFSRDERTSIASLDLGRWNASQMILDNLWIGAIKYSAGAPLSLAMVNCKVDFLYLRAPAMYLYVHKSEIASTPSPGSVLSLHTFYASGSDFCGSIDVTADWFSLQGVRVLNTLRFRVFLRDPLVDDAFSSISGSGFYGVLDFSIGLARTEAFSGLSAESLGPKSRGLFVQNSTFDARWRSGATVRFHGPVHIEDCYFRRFAADLFPPVMMVAPHGQVSIVNCRAKENSLSSRDRAALFAIQAEVVVIERAVVEGTEEVAKSDGRGTCHSLIVVEGADFVSAVNSTFEALRGASRAEGNVESVQTKHIRVVVKVQQRRPRIVESGNSYRRVPLMDSNDGVQTAPLLRALPFLGVDNTTDCVICVNPCNESVATKTTTRTRRSRRQGDEDRLLLTGQRSRESSGICLGAIDASAGSCNPCAPGYIANFTSGRCDPCPPGTYELSNLFCVVCASTFWTSGYASTACEELTTASLVYLTVVVSMMPVVYVCILLRRVAISRKYRRKRANRAQQ